MPLDSSANLLFTIGANSDDATGNIQAFRALLGKNLSDIGGEFDDWKDKVLGDVSTVGAALTVGGAVIAAGLVAAGAAAVHCADQYEQYVEGVAKASKITGIAVEDMSRLKFAVEMTGGNLDTLTQGLARYTTVVVKGAQGSQAQLTAFERLGISQAQLIAGEHDALPLLEAVADKFANLKDKTERTAEARDLFGRGGAQFLNFLSLGSDGMKQMANEADRLGLIVGVKDVEALHAYKAALAEMKAVQESVDIQVGRATLPLVTNLRLGWAALIQTMGQFGGPNGQSWTTTWAMNLAAMKVSAEGLAASLSRIGKNQLTPPTDDAPKVEKTKEAWSGLSDLLEQVKLKLAGTVSEEAKAAEEVNKIGIEMAKAVEKLDELRPKLKDGIFDKQYADAQELLKLIPELYKRMMDGIAEKRRIAGEEARAQLARQLASEQVQTIEAREAEWNAERDKQAAANQKNIKMEGDLSAEIAALRKAGLDRIHRDAAEAELRAEADRLQKIAARQAEFGVEMAALAKHLEQIRASHQTAEERIAAQYAADVEKFTAAEEKKRIAAATSDAQRTAITAQYAAIRAALLTKEGADLQALRNSQGWRGVFGSEFGALIKGNEALTREWATSTNQSLMMVRVSMEGLKEMGQQAFNSLTQGMGQNIADAIVYKKSIGEAMKAALAATLETVASESIVYAIRSTALGFMRLAEHDPAGAASAFTAAAIWGSVGAAAAVTGRAVAPAAAGAAASAGGGGASVPGAAASGSGGSNAQGGQTPGLTINVDGHLYGNADAVIDAINEAVLERRKTLTATNTTSGQVVRR